MKRGIVVIFSSVKLSKSHSILEIDKLDFFDIVAKFGQTANRAYIFQTRDLALGTVSSRFGCLDRLSRFGCLGPPSRRGRGRRTRRKSGSRTGRRPRRSPSSAKKME